jgi:transcription initiation factor TFIIF subunit beta
MSIVRDAKPDIKPDVKPKVQPPLEEDEKLNIHPTFKDNNIWALKVPRFLLERWERVTEGGKELGTLVVDNSSADLYPCL